MSERSTAVVFLARGYERDHMDRFRRFLRSYNLYSSGHGHRLCVIFKGFQSCEAEAEARDLFGSVPHSAYRIDDVGFDIGAYARVLSNIDEEFVCFLNSHSEIVSENWLSKLAVNLDDSAVGLVGATGSHESLNYIHPDFPAFPNPHLRTNTFMLRVSHARRYFPDQIIGEKSDAWRFESGEDSLTRRISSRGLACLVVGRNGRGYGQNSWSQSETYRQGLQSNLLVSDNVTRSYNSMMPVERAAAIRRTWGAAVPPRLFIAKNFTVR